MVKHLVGKVLEHKEWSKKKGLVTLTVDTYGDIEMENPDGKWLCISLTTEELVSLNETLSEFIEMRKEVKEHDIRIGIPQ
tara:strand:- start:84 stop:323 length:240 start_codon:yes stop_codon:yes gene_type:complete